MVEASAAVGEGSGEVICAGSVVGEAVTSGVAGTALPEQAAEISANMGGSTLKINFLNIFLPDGCREQVAASQRF